MIKFKVGDRVRVIDNSGDARAILKDIATVISDTDLVKVEGSDGKVYRMFRNRFELVTTKKENSTMVRRTFKLLRDTPSTKKGAILQEECEDGTQPYSEINGVEFHKGTDHRPYSLTDRSLVEEAPEWFVEVFKVEPEYMTREELDKYNEFVGRKKLGRPVKAVEKRTKGRPGRFERTPAMRAAQSRKMKAYYARKKRQAR